MNVANLELCKELYELSGWGRMDNVSSIEFYYNKRFISSDVGFRMELDHWTDVAQQAAHLNMKVKRGNAVPAYDLGYLLRKLPGFPAIQKLNANPDEWLLEAMALGYHASGRADTPEGAAAKLAIELFKQGVLTKPEKGEQL